MWYKEKLDKIANVDVFFQESKCDEKEKHVDLAVDLEMKDTMNKNNQRMKLLKNNYNNNNNNNNNKITTEDRYPMICITYLH